MKKLLHMVVVAMILVSMAGTANATTWDLGSDWSNSGAPMAGVWTLMEGNNILGPVNNWYGTQQIAYANTAFGQTQSAYFIPAWLKLEQFFYNTLTAYGSAFSVGDIVVHATDYISPYSSAVWTSPIDGTIEISGDIWWGGWTGETRATVWTLYVNDILVDQGAVGYGTGDPSTQQIDAGNTTYDILVGQTVKLVLTNRPGYYSWFTGLDFTITGQENPHSPVPEPTTMLLFGTGLIGLAAASRRKRS